MKGSEQDIVDISGHYDFDVSLRFVRMGSNDPTCKREPGRVLYARDYTSGPATLELKSSGKKIRLEAWGEGASEALQKAPALLGLHDPGAEITAHPLMSQLNHRLKGLRLSRQPDLTIGLVQTVLQQLVTWSEAASSWRELSQLQARAAPGPYDLLMPPALRWLRFLEPADYSICDVSAKRAAALRQIARLGDRPERWAQESPEVFSQKLQTISGIGPWTVQHCLGFHFGAPDAVIVGDYGIPHLISWALIEKARSNDEEMCQLLEPFSGQRFRVLRLLMAADYQAPRFGPKVASSRPARRYGSGRFRR